MRMKEKRQKVELQRKVNQSKCSFSKCLKSSRNTTITSFVAAREMVKQGKPFTDSEYVKESFIRMSE